MKIVSKKVIRNRRGGFTLIEIMVSVSVFVVIMVISMGTIVTIIDANRKSQSLRTVMDNLNFTIEAMTRTIRFATNYHCDVTIIDPLVTLPRDCVAGATSIVVLASNGDTVTYKLSGTQIKRDINSFAGIDSSDYSLTSSDVTITDLSFRVIGSYGYGGGANKLQPQVIITIGGYSGSKLTSRSSFLLQTTVSQRVFDSQN